MSLLIVGSIALDTLETPLGKETDIVGGSTVYAAYAASLFTKPAIVGVVGEDFPLREIANLKRKGVRVEGVEMIPGGKTFRWGGRYLADINQRETLFTELGVFGSFAPRLPDAYRNMSDLFLGNIDPDIQYDLLRQMKTPRLVVCDTMNLWIKIKRPSLERLLKKGVDVLLVNDEEARMLAGTPSLRKAAEVLRRGGIGRVIIKKGEHGSLMFGPEGAFAAPAPALPVVKDPTGAGDTFAGGMIGWLSGRTLTEANWRKAIVAGTAMASFCVEEFGARRLRRVTKEQFTRRATQLRDMMSVGKI